MRKRNPSASQALPHRVPESPGTSRAGGDACESSSEGSRVEGDEVAPTHGDFPGIDPDSPVPADPPKAMSVDGLLRAFQQMQIDDLDPDSSAKDESPLPFGRTDVMAGTARGEVTPSAVDRIAAAIECATCGEREVTWSQTASRCRCDGCGALSKGDLADLARQVGSQASPSCPGDQVAVQLFQLNDVIARAASLDGLEADVRERTKQSLAKLVRSGETRPLSRLSRTWSAQLDDLAAKHPNFAEVIEQNVRPAMAIRAAGGFARQAPVLLLGEPGVGKSHFAGALGKCLQVPVLKIDIATAQNASALAGSSTFWSNSAPGELLRSLAYGTASSHSTADLVVFADEVDKAGAGLTYDPLGPLYSLLEVESARNFTDESLPGIRLDASHLRWILACNSIDGIPGPIRSRVQIFDIDPPSPEEKRAMFERIFAGLVTAARLAEFETRLPQDVLGEVASIGLREFKTVANTAIGRALLAGRRMVEVADFRSPGNSLSSSRRTKIGFV